MKEKESKIEQLKVEEKNEESEIFRSAKEELQKPENRETAEKFAETFFRIAEELWDEKYPDFFDKFLPEITHWAVEKSSANKEGKKLANKLIDLRIELIEKLKREKGVKSSLGMKYEDWDAMSKTFKDKGREIVFNPFKDDLVNYLKELGLEKAIKKDSWLKDPDRREAVFFSEAQEYFDKKSKELSVYYDYGSFIRALLGYVEKTYVDRIKRSYALENYSHSIRNGLLPWTEIMLNPEHVIKNHKNQLLFIKKILKEDFGEKSEEKE